MPALALVLVALPAVGPADDRVERLLFLTVEADRLIAANARFNRVDELELHAREHVVEQATGNAVAVVVTTRRLIGYSVFTAAWRSERLKAGEQVETLQAEDASAMVRTSQRTLIFSGRNGVWSDLERGPAWR